jgi:protein-disulfide isomerase
MTRTLPALALALGLATPALADDDFAFDAMNDDERVAFGEAVRDYLLENPDVIMEAVAVLERRQAAEQVANDAALIATNHDAIFDDPMSYVGGNPDGDVTFVEFVDYKCGYCRKAFPELQALLEADGNIRIIYKEFPILGEESLLASRFAVSAKLVGGDAAYGPLHDALMTMRGNVTEDSLVALADGLGIDGAAVLDGMDDPQVDAVLGENHALASRLQITGTPTFVIGEQLVRGYVPLEAMGEVVAELREAQGQ